MPSSPWIRALVMEEAEVLDHRLRRGEDPGPLAGVPVGVKDLMSVRGYPLTAGTRAIEAKVQERDAPVVARLRAAGALIVGTTNLHELAFGVNSANPHFGHVQNPRYPGHHSGRFQWRIGCGCCRRTGRHRGGLLHRRFDSPARRVLRHRRLQADLRRRAARGRAIRWPGRWITSARSPAASKMRRSHSKSWPDCRSIRLAGR